MDLLILFGVYFFQLVTAYPAEQVYSMSPESILSHISFEKEIAPYTAPAVNTPLPDGFTILEPSTKQQLPCGTPEVPKNGHMSYLINREGLLFAVYKCNPGWGMGGKSMRTCQGNGKWSGIQPICKSILSTTNNKTIPNKIPPSGIVTPSNSNAEAFNKSQQLTEGADKDKNSAKNLTDGTDHSEILNKLQHFEKKSMGLQIAAIVLICVVVLGLALGIVYYIKRKRVKQGEKKSTTTIKSQEPRESEQQQPLNPKNQENQ